MKRAILLTALTLTLTACGNPLGSSQSKVGGDFHPGAPNSVAPVAAPPVPAVGADTGMKIGPGSLRAVGSSVAIKASITPNDRVLKGSTVSGRFSLNKAVLR